MTCAKKQVTCWLVRDGNVIGVGTNDCLTPQEFCPRELGEDYLKCKTVCHQEGHAEIRALQDCQERAESLGYTDGAKGAEAFVQGIGWYCRDCQEKLFAAGVMALRIIK